MRPLLFLALLAGALAFAAACRGGDDDRAAGIIHRLLQAGLSGGGGTLESFVGRLPDDLPAAVPQYPDADLIVSSRRPAASGAIDVSAEAPQSVLYFIVLDTGDDRRRVFSFYEEALDADPWQLEDSFSTEELDTLFFTKVDDADISGAVAIAPWKEDGRTSILISLQDAGVVLGEEPPFELGASLPVPKEFPPDVPVYRGATVTSTAFSRAPGDESLLLIFLTTDSQDDVIEFYRETFEGHGWTVSEGAAFGLGQSIDFRDEGRDIQGEVLADRFSRDRKYTEVTIQLLVNPARELEDGEEATPASPTPADSTAVPSGPS